MQNYTHIKKRADFLLAAKSGFRFVKPSLIVQSRKRDDDDACRAGFTATKRIGNAVIRNRTKRRLRAAAAKLLPEIALNSCDYVFIGREQTHKAEFSDILRDMRHSLKVLGEQMNGVPAKPKKSD